MFEVNDFRMAQKAFQRCFTVMRAEEIEYEISAGKVDVMGLGDKWKLEMTRVDWNGRTSAFEKWWKAERVERPGGRKYRLNGIPVGVLFEPCADMFAIKVDLPGSLVWENGGLEEYLKRYNLNVKESLGRTSSKKQWRDSSMSTDKPLPSLPFDIRGQAVGALQLATRRRMKNSPNNTIPSPIVPPKADLQGITIPRTATSAPPTSKSIRTLQDIIRWPRSSNPSTRRNSPTLPWNSPRTQSSPIDAPLLPHEMSHLPEIASQGLNRRCLDQGSARSHDYEPITSSPESLARQPHPETPSTATIDFAYENQSNTNTRLSSDSHTGLHIVNLGSMGRTERKAPSPGTNSSFYELYLDSEQAAGAKTANELEKEEDTEEEKEDENGDYFEIILLPQGYRPQLNGEDPSETSQGTKTKRISMFIDPDPDPRPASSVRSTQTTSSVFQKPTEGRHPASSVYSTQTKRMPTDADPGKGPRLTSSIYSTYSQPTSMYEAANPRPAPSVYSTQTERASSTFPIATKHRQPASSIYSTQTQPTSMHEAQAPHPAPSVYSTHTERASTFPTPANGPRAVSSVYSVQTERASTFPTPTKPPKPAPFVYSTQTQPTSMHEAQAPRPAPSLYSAHTERASAFPISAKYPRPAPSISSIQDRRMSRHRDLGNHRPASSVYSAESVRAATHPVESQAVDPGSEGGNMDEMVLLPRTFEGFKKG
ncbi:MAG: hypothetical protein FRX48_08373 [Lasallia pustulata]|uniref:Uncharacterized protein n=1 Tax=Lasallia pustulata TaxID=136370 RepID=A0A5M8PHB8_9LECA|nr:MAG: hypothetical protein FRX48_08373 [Lasallia pustulata]